MNFFEWLSQNESTVLVVLAFLLTLCGLTFKYMHASRCTRLQCCCMSFERDVPPAADPTFTSAVDEVIDSFRKVASPTLSTTASPAASTAASPESRRPTLPV